MNLAAEIDAVARETIDWNERPTQEVTPLLAEFGIGRRFHSEEPAGDELAALREFAASVGDPSNAVFMDTTTLFTVCATPPSPAATSCASPWGTSGRPRTT
jgi:hypothetical protein